MTAVPSSLDRTTFRYTVERYHAAIAAGVLTELDKLELIDGELIEKMPIGKKHRDCVDKINLYFVRRFGDVYLCAGQNPITIPPHSEPEPDYALVDREQYAIRDGNPEPADIHLLIEVANATLDYDRGPKARLYAGAGVPEYWVIDLQHDRVEVYLDPDSGDGTYDQVRRYRKGEAIDSPRCGRVRVDDLLPY